MKKKGEDRRVIIEELKQGNISLILDSYNDIFSSFDPRPYSEKGLSDDFLVECKKAAVDKRGGTELRLLIPGHKRNIDDEAKIRKRLKNHFQKHYKENEGEYKKIIKQGGMLFSVGIILMLTASLLYHREGFLFTMMLVIFEPAGWFMAWIGLERMFIEPKQKMADMKFYEKMRNVKIDFYSY